MATFDALAFDGALFDCGAAVARPTLGGWTRAATTEPAWTPSIIARGSEWAKTANAGPQWASADIARGAAWAAKPKSNATW